MSDLKEQKIAVLQFLDTIKKSVECAVKIEGDFSWERPSLRADVGEVAPKGFIGVNHLRYSLQLDILENPQSLATKVNDNES